MLTVSALVCPLVSFNEGFKSTARATLECVCVGWYCEWSGANGLPAEVLKDDRVPENCTHLTLLNPIASPFTHASAVSGLVFVRGNNSLAHQRSRHAAQQQRRRPITRWTFHVNSPARTNQDHLDRARVSPELTQLSTLASPPTRTDSSDIQAGVGYVVLLFFCTLFYRSRGSTSGPDHVSMKPNPRGVVKCGVLSNPQTPRLHASRAVTSSTGCSVFSCGSGCGCAACWCLWYTENRSGSQSPVQSCFVAVAQWPIH